MTLYLYSIDGVYKVLKKQIDMKALEQKIAFTDWFSEYPWEAMITVRTPVVCRSQQAYDAIKDDVIRPLAMHHRTQFGCLVVVNMVESSHSHVLALSKRGELSWILNSRRNLGIAHQVLKTRRGTILTHKDAIKIEPCYSRGGLDYTAGNLTYYPDFSDIYYYNRRLLDDVRGAGNWRTA